LGVLDDGADGAYGPSASLEERDPVDRFERHGRFIEAGHLPHRPSYECRGDHVSDPPDFVGAVQIVGECAYLRLVEVEQQAFGDDQGVLGAAGRVG